MLLEIGRETVHGGAEEDLLAEAAADLLAEALDGAEDEDVEAGAAP